MALFAQGFVGFSLLFIIETRDLRWWRSVTFPVRQLVCRCVCIDRCYRGDKEKEPSKRMENGDEREGKERKDDIGNGKSISLTGYHYGKACTKARKEETPHRAAEKRAGRGRPQEDNGKYRVIPKDLFDEDVQKEREDTIDLYTRHIEREGKEERKEKRRPANKTEGIRQGRKRGDESEEIQLPAVLFHRVKKRYDPSGKQRYEGTLAVKDFCLRIRPQVNDVISLSLSLPSPLGKTGVILLLLTRRHYSFKT